MFRLREVEVAAEREEITAEDVGGGVLDGGVGVWVTGK